MNLPFHFRARSTVSTTSSAMRGSTNTIVGQVQMSGEEDSIRTSWFRIKVEKDAMSELADVNKPYDVGAVYSSI